MEFLAYLELAKQFKRNHSMARLVRKTISALLVTQMANFIRQELI